MHKLDTMLYFETVILFSFKQLRFWSYKAIVMRCLNELNDYIIHLKSRQSIFLLAVLPGCHTELIVTPWNWNVIVTEAVSLLKHHKLTHKKQKNKKNNLRWPRVNISGAVLRSWRKTSDWRNASRPSYICMTACLSQWMSAFFNPCRGEPTEPVPR